MANNNNGSAPVRKMFEAQGRFLIPGSRQVETFLGRVFAPNPQEGSRALQRVLLEKFGEKLPPRHTFSPDFALMNLRWRDMGVAAAKQMEESQISALELMRASCEIPIPPSSPIAEESIP